MYIQSITPNIQNRTATKPSFQCNIQKLFQTVEGLKVFKGMTEFDRRCLLAYINSKPYMMGITTKEIDELSKFDGKEFITKTADFIMDRFKIPEEVKPPVIFDDMTSDGIMAYSPSTNYLIVDIKKLKNLPKNTIFGLLRHEITHLQQNMSVLRHETIGVKAVEEYTNVAAPIYRKLLLESFEKDANMDVDKAIAMQIIRPEHRYILENAKILYDQWGTDACEAYVEKEIAKEHKRELYELRNKIIYTCGGIIPDGCANEQLEAGLNEFLRNGYMDKVTQRIDYNKYFTNILENEALIAQQVSEFEFSKSGCYIKYQKDLLEEQLKNPITREFLESTIPD